MKKNKQTIAKYTRLYAIGLWGILSIIWLSGEPIDDMALGKFCLLKGIGLASLGLCCLVGKGSIKQDCCLIWTMKMIVRYELPGM